MVKPISLIRSGLITIASDFSVAETIDRLESVVRSKGLMVFLRIDHSANATQVGMELRPTQLLIFGNPKGGTPLMQDKQTAGLDLPVRALAWEDANGLVWLSYDDPVWVARRHDLGVHSDPSVRAIEAGLALVTKAAASAE
jgi:uncharacterized protein (DUF302 family)